MTLWLAGRNFKAASPPVYCFLVFCGILSLTVRVAFKTFALHFFFPANDVYCQRISNRGPRVAIYQSPCSLYCNSSEKLKNGFPCSYILSATPFTSSSPFNSLTFTLSFTFMRCVYNRKDSTQKSNITDEYYDI